VANGEDDARMDGRRSGGRAEGEYDTLGSHMDREGELRST